MENQGFNYSPKKCFSTSSRLARIKSDNLRDTAKSPFSSGDFASLTPKGIISAVLYLIDRKELIRSIRDSNYILDGC
jgi:hypothetical protein